MGGDEELQGLSCARPAIIRAEGRLISAAGAEMPPGSSMYILSWSNARMAHENACLRRRACRPDLIVREKIGALESNRWLLRYIGLRLSAAAVCCATRRQMTLRRPVSTDRWRGARPGCVKNGSRRRFVPLRVLQKRKDGWCVWIFCLLEGRQLAELVMSRQARRSGRARIRRRPSGNRRRATCIRGATPEVCHGGD